MRHSDPLARTLGLLALLLGALAAGLPAPALADVVYQHDFETPAGAEWSHGTREVTPSGRGFLGQFGNDTVTLRLQDLPAHTTVSVSFDLFVLRSWDGSGENGWGPDVWSASVEGGPTLLESTFSYPGCIINRQAFPAPYGRGLFLGGTGAAEMNSLGYTFRFPDLTAPLDAVYRFSFTFPHNSPTVGLKFAASGLQELGDESWGLDNVRVELRDAAPGKLAVSPKSLNFGTLRPGMSRFKDLRLRNTGRGPLTASVSLPFYPFSGAGTERFTLAPGQSRTVRVTFSPKERASYADLLVVTTDDPKRAVSAVSLRGRVR